MDERHYVPVLQARRGELIALRELPTSIRERITPLLEVAEVVWDWVQDEPAKTLEQHLSAFPANLKKSWSDRPFFIDLPNLLYPDERIDGKHPLIVLCDGLRKEGLLPIPVTGNHKDDDYRAAVKAVVAQDGRGACIRVSGTGLEMAASISADLHAELEIARDDIDLLLDLASINETNASVAAVAVRSILTSEEFGSYEWRSVVVTSGAFPASMAGLVRGVHALPRADWLLWLHVRDLLPGGVRIPTFGDYGIQSPGWEPIDPRFMRASANIRYAASEEWIVVRGRIVLGKGAVGMQEYVGLCQILRDRPEYRGPDFSPGDRYIAQCAAGEIPPGTPEISRRQGTSHHVVTVVDQLSS